MTLWADKLMLGQRWSEPWIALIECSDCYALFDPAAPCPVCGKDYRPLGGKVFAGLLEWSTYVLLELMRREWETHQSLKDDNDPILKKIPKHSQIVLLFWVFFEASMHRLFKAAMKLNMNERVAQDLLRRYSGIGQRIDRLYPILFECKFSEDLKNVGFPELGNDLTKIQLRRNDFVHGNPEAIDHTLVIDTVTILPEFQNAWVKLYNLHCTIVKNRK